MSKKELDILGRIFAAEIDGKLPCQLRDSKTLQALLEDGCVQPDEIKIGGRFPMTIRGYALTHRGRILYCESCKTK